MGRPALLGEGDERTCALRKAGAPEEFGLLFLLVSPSPAWVEARAEGCGFAVDLAMVRCEGYRQHRLPRRGGAVRFSTLDIERILEVTVPEVFARTLRQGVGPCKAFGCGLLLVRRS